MRGASTQGYYDEFSGWYERERHHGYHAMLDDLESSIIQPLGLGRDVLEVGCGTGLIMRRLAAGTRSVVGLDLSAGMLRQAAERGLRTVQGSAHRLPFADGSFDLAYSFKVLAHVPQIRETLAEMARVLRPGGHLVAEFYNHRSLRYWAKRLGGPGRISRDHTEDEVFTRWDTRRDILGYLPPNVHLEHWRGVRVLTPAAGVFRLPGAERVLPAAERLAMTSPLARYGGFLVAVCRRD